MEQFEEDDRFTGYLNETWFDTHEARRWINKSDMCSLNGRQIIILHVGEILSAKTKT